LPTNAFPGTTALPFWDDLYIYPYTTQGIYYAAQGNAPNRTLVFEFYMSYYKQPARYYHFHVIFFEAQPGIVQYKYFYASDGGVNCTIGVQGKISNEYLAVLLYIICIFVASSSGPFIQHSFRQANSIHQNMTLTFNTIDETYSIS
jgi:hypothetical protein